MLNNYEYGFAVMTEKLDAYSFEDINLDTCKRYCREGYVIVERIPYVCGISIRINWYKFYKVFEKRYRQVNFLWLHISWSKNHLHKTGKVVFKPQKQ